MLAMLLGILTSSTPRRPGHSARVDAPPQRDTPAEREDRDRGRIWANVTFAVSQVLAAALPAIGIGGKAGVRTIQNPSPLVPPDEFFWVWGIILSLALAYAWHQARSRHRTDRLLRGIGGWTAATFALNTLRLVIAQVSGSEFATFVIQLGLWGCALVTLVRITPFRHILHYSETVTILIPFSLLAAWTTAATFLSLAGLLGSYLPGTSVPEYIALTGAALAGAIMVIRSQANLWHDLTLVYAFTGMVIRTVGDGRYDLAMMVWMALLTVAVTAGSYRFRAKQLESSPFS